MMINRLHFFNAYPHTVYSWTCGCMTVFYSTTLLHDISDAVVSLLPQEPFILFTQRRELSLPRQIIWVWAASKHQRAELGKNNMPLQYVFFTPVLITVMNVLVHTSSQRRERFHPQFSAKDNWPPPPCKGQWESMNVWNINQSSPFV